MGHHIWSDVVPFVAHDVFILSHYDNISDLDPEDIKFIDAYVYLDGDWEEDDEAWDAVDKENVTRDDWKFDKSDLAEVGKKGRLYGQIWRKGDYTVYLVNESHYSNIGDYCVAVCADDKDSVREFLKDFNINKPIEEMDSVDQSG